MTCAYEEDLALYVERDLPAAAAETVEAHLGTCACCRAFLAELRASQALVKDVASEEIEPEALASVRVRLVVAAGSSPPRLRGDEQVPALAAAAAIVLALGALGWVVWLVGSTEPKRSVAAVAPSRVVPPAVVPLADRSPALAGRESTLPVARSVSPRMERTQAPRGRADRRPAVPALSPDDADQLARAVVAIARIQSVDDVRPDVEAPAAPPLMRLATADPDVVIYWQLDPSGGE